MISLPHDCATELWRLGDAPDYGETHDCGCGRLWTYRVLTRARLLLNRTRSAQGGALWVRNRWAERAARRGQRVGGGAA